MMVLSQGLIVLNWPPSVKWLDPYNIMDLVNFYCISVIEYKGCRCLPWIFLAGKTRLLGFCEQNAHILLSHGVTGYFTTRYF